jgi:hypothetical protein
MEQAQSDFPRRVAYWFYLLLLLGGIALYFAWGVAFGSWNIATREHAGIYTLTILMAGFGVTGLLLYRRKAQ